MLLSLKETFLSLHPHPEHWAEITRAYQEKHRAYHTLAHLKHLLATLTPLQPLFKDWKAVLYSVFYHDFIYSPTSKTNEEDSAAFAATRINSTQVQKLILATKNHHLHEDQDINLFTDADLSILGASPTKYAIYAQNVRQEYAIYPDFLYKKGRKSVLTHFLAMPRIFKTDYFFAQFEAAARLNLEKECLALYS